MKNRRGKERKEKAKTVRAPTPAGNAVYDPREQTRRTDLRPDEQSARGAPGRGSEPPPGEPGLPSSAEQPAVTKERRTAPVEGREVESEG